MTNVTVGSGVDLTLRSLNIISLYPGVNISQGANFQAYADIALIMLLIEHGNLLFQQGDYDGGIAKFELTAGRKNPFIKNILSLT